MVARLTDTCVLDYGSFVTNGTMVYTKYTCTHGMEKIQFDFATIIIITLNSKFNRILDVMIDTVIADRYSDSSCSATNIISSSVALLGSQSVEVGSTYTEYYETVFSCVTGDTKPMLLSGNEYSVFIERSGGCAGEITYFDATDRSICYSLGDNAAEIIDLPYLYEYFGAACEPPNLTSTLEVQSSCSLVFAGGDLYYEWRITEGGQDFIAACGKSSQMSNTSLRNTNLCVDCSA